MLQRYEKFLNKADLQLYFFHFYLAVLSNNEANVSHSFIGKHHTLLTYKILITAKLLLKRDVA